MSGLLRFYGIGHGTIIDLAHIILLRQGEKDPILIQRLSRLPPQVQKGGYPWVSAGEMTPDESHGGSAAQC